MDIVITMAGAGSRFRKAGYTVPKFMIEAKGKTLFEWSMDSLKGFITEDTCFYFIVRKEDDAVSFIKDKASEFCRQCRVIEIDYLTDGQATTAMLCKDYWRKDKPLLIYNIDTYVEPYEMKLSDVKGAGFIPCFNGKGDHWSFVRLDENGKGAEVREKTRISENCTLGAYYFESCKLYEDIYEEYYYGDGNLEKGEKYVAPMYNYMIEKGYEIYISTVDANKVHILGTPEELKEFING